MKKKTFLLCRTVLGYCSNYIVKKKIVLQGWIVLQAREKKLYCDNRFCIAIIEIVLQRRRELRAICVAIQYFCIVEKKT